MNRLSNRISKYKTVKFCVALIIYKEGNAVISHLKLKGDLSFAPYEMEKWIKEQSERPVKEVRFLEGTK